MQRSPPKQDPFDTNFDSATEQDAPSSPAREGDAAGGRNHPRSAPVGLSCPARHANYPMAMKYDAQLIAVEARPRDVGREHDVRNWCTQLDCTEAEVRDTVRAIMRLMANTRSRRVFH